MRKRSELRTQFLVLYRHFLMRVIDLEALSAQADVVRLLGQFASVLVMISIIQGGSALLIDLRQMPMAAQLNTGWTMEHRLIATTMVVVGMFAVLSWDTTFPDRRDVMVIAPLPVRARTLFFAKVAASGTMLALSIAILNVISGLSWPLVLSHGGVLGAVRSLCAYWLTIFAAGTFLYSCVLTVQGVCVQFLPRRYALRLSAVFQLAGFCLFLGTFFLEPALVNQAALADPESLRVFARLPSFWFFGLFHQLNGSMNAAFEPLVRRAWIGLALAGGGALSTMLVSYFRTMRTIVEEPDMVPARHKPGWAPRVGDALQTCVLYFSVRSLLRSRQHRVVVAFYLGVGFAIALSCLSIPAATEAGLAVHPASLRFLISTIVMMTFAVVGVRVAFALPVSLTANWMLRVTQIRPAAAYLSATRRSLLALSVAPVLVGAAVLSLPFEPWGQVAEHVLVLAVLGGIFTEVSLLGFHKVPFSCSALPGKANVQFVFWVYVVMLIPLTEESAQLEQRALGRPLEYVACMGTLGVALLGFWMWNRRQWRTAVLRFEERAEEEIVTLKL
ncbi:MAG: hypothetical protein WBY53_02215 [Acidobacteriaceae bacterium]